MILITHVDVGTVIEKNCIATCADKYLIVSEAIIKAIRKTRIAFMLSCKFLIFFL